jgi:hypothetical protein
VIDAATAAPLARATVTLTAADGFGLFLDPRGTPPSLALARTVTTSDVGAYRFTDLPIGAYRLRIQHGGYEPTTVDVRLGDAGTPSVSVGLVVLPVRLRVVEVRATGAAAPVHGARSTSTLVSPRYAHGRLHFFRRMRAS